MEETHIPESEKPAPPGVRLRDVQAIKLCESIPNVNLLYKEYMAYLLMIENDLLKVGSIMYGKIDELGANLITLHTPFLNGFAKWNITAPITDYEGDCEALKHLLRAFRDKTISLADYFFRIEAKLNLSPETRVDVTQDSTKVQVSQLVIKGIRNAIAKKKPVSELSAEVPSVYTKFAGIRIANGFLNALFECADKESNNVMVKNNSEIYRHNLKSRASIKSRIGVKSKLAALDEQFSAYAEMDNHNLEISVLEAVSSCYDSVKTVGSFVTNLNRELSIDYAGIKTLEDIEERFTKIVDIHACVMNEIFSVSLEIRLLELFCRYANCAGSSDGAPSPAQGNQPENT